MDASTVFDDIIALAESAFDAANEIDLERLEVIQKEISQLLLELSKLSIKEDNREQIQRAIEIQDSICTVLEENKQKYKKQISEIQTGIEANRAYQSNQDDYF